MTLYKNRQDLLDIKYIIFSRSKAEGLGLAQPLSSPAEYSLLAWSRSSPEFQPWSGHFVALYSFSCDKHIQVSVIMNQVRQVKNLQGKGCPIECSKVMSSQVDFTIVKVIRKIFLKA